jgi:hypothetical protein
MNPSTLRIAACMTIVALTLAGCASGKPGPGTRPVALTKTIGSTPPPRTTTGRSAATAATAAVAADPQATARAIDAIIYSDLTKDLMLQRLQPFVAVMDSTEEFRTKTGLDFEFGFGSGPGVMDYSVGGTGLSLVVDPDHKIRIIRRMANTVGGKAYPAMSISAPRFNWNGYSRWYPE